MRGKPTIAGFSLMEVVLAVALCAVAITAVLALLPTLTRQGTEATDLLAAQRLTEPLTVELERLAAHGFDALAQHVPEMTVPLGAGMMFVAGRDGVGLQSMSFLPPASSTLGDEARYFLIECWRFPSGPLRYDDAGAVMALHARVSWPYRLPGLAMPVEETSRHEIAFTVAINR